MSISEIKNEAKLRLSQSYFKLLFINLVYTLIVVLLQQGEAFFTNTLNGIYMCVEFFLFLILTYGLVSASMKCVRNEKVGIADFIFIGFTNTLKILKVLGRILLELIIPVIINAVSIVFWIYTNLIENNTLVMISSAIFIATTIYLIIKSLKFVLTLYIIHDNINIPSKEIVDKSKKLMKGNIGKYIFLNLSFILWYLLIFFIPYTISFFYLNDLVIESILQIGLLLLTPYVDTSIICFYENLDDSSSN